MGRGFKIHHQEMNNSQMTPEEKYQIERILKEISDFPVSDKISKLREYKAGWQSLPDIRKIRPFETDFAKQIDAHIERFQHELGSTPNVFKLSEKQGAKSDLLQVFYALHKLHLIEKKTGGFPSQKEFLQEFGKFFGEDWSNPSALIAQRRETPDNKQDEVFDDLKKKWRRKT